MNKILTAAISGVVLVSVAGCGTIGKGKGKAPPPAAAPIIIDEPAPVFK